MLAYHRVASLKTKQQSEEGERCSAVRANEAAKKDERRTENALLKSLNE
jgi:hypothetical protein